MKTPSPEISDAERAVNAYKHELLVRVMAAIIRVAFTKPFFSPADIPEDIVADAHRQGCTSNGWNALTALEIIERLSMGFTDEERKIFGGRIKNTNPGAKSRWTACYKLKSKTLADTWMIRNKQAASVPKPVATEQLALV